MSTAVMSRFNKVLQSLRRQPAYTLMRGVARFATVRALVVAARSLWHRGRVNRYRTECARRLGDSLFAGLDVEGFVRRLHADGVAHGLKLPPAVVAEIRAWAEAHPCYADRDPRYGFFPLVREPAERHLGKPILLGQHFNAASDCPVIQRLAEDPALQCI